MSAETTTTLRCDLCEDEIVVRHPADMILVDQVWRLHAVARATAEAGGWAFDKQVEATLDLCRSCSEGRIIELKRRGPA